MIVPLTYPTFLLVFPKDPLLLFFFFLPFHLLHLGNAREPRAEPNTECEDKTINVLTETLELAYRRVNIAQHNLHTPNVRGSERDGNRYM